MTQSNTSRRLRAEEFRIRPEDRPDWIRGSIRLLAVGEEVLCTGGSGTLAAVLGKTGDGSRLLEIHLAEPGAKPFFAAASNVLVAPS